MADSTPTAEMIVRKPVGAVICAIVLAAFLLFFVSLAVYNLLNYNAIIASVIWLLLVFTVTFGFCKE